MTHQPIIIRQAEHKDQKRWDAYIFAHPDATPYHLFAWKLTIEDSYGHHCHYLYAEINDQLVGILPLVHIRFFNIVNELTALPYCDVGGCLCDNSVIQDTLLNAALETKQTLNSSNLYLRGPLVETRLKSETCFPEETSKVRMLLNLPSTSEELFSNFKSKLRSQVRKAKKNGIVFRWSGSEEIDAIYSVFSKNMRDLGSPVHAKSWLNAVLKHYNQKAKVGLVEFEDKIIGMGIILHHGQDVAIPWASTLREYNRLGPNMLLYWNFLKYSADNGYRIFDFGRSTKDEGTYRFKQQWGAQPEPLTWYSCSRSGQYHTAGRQQTKKRNTIAAIWAKTPLPIANLAGPILRKYISL